MGRNKPVEAELHYTTCTNNQCSNVGGPALLITLLNVGVG